MPMPAMIVAFRKLSQTGVELVKRSAQGATKGRK
jgi:hypothetical protein